MNESIYKSPCVASWARCRLRLTLFVLMVLAGMSSARAGLASLPSAAWDPLERAARHAIKLDKPALTFFEGGVLGNGGMGVIVCTRPDAVVIRFGHNEVWDIRIEEIPMERLGTFEQVWSKIKQSKDDPEAIQWVKDYCRMAGEPYRKEYPRPWPCGSLILGFDRRSAELLGHQVRLQDGVCEVRFLINGQVVRLEVFPEMAHDRLWLRMVDAAGQPAAGPFDRVLLIPERGMPFNATRGPDALSFRQILASLKPDPAKDQALRMSVRLSGQLAVDPGPAEEPNFRPDAGPFAAVVEMNHGLTSDVPRGAADLPRPEVASVEAAIQTVRQSWRSYWSRSGVALADATLEAIWYRNLYFMNCAVRPGVRCPGLFGNWSWGKIGSAWHGDYHANYNVQQPFWGVFATNHVDKHIPYVELVHFLLPVSQRWARDFYQLPGAFFPHSSYPVPMTVPPYPVPALSLEVCETPWTVQSLWWHYRYTKDRQYLREKLFGPMREAVRFLNAYMRRPEAHGPASPFKDDRFHIYPTQSPEIFPILKPEHNDMRFNADCLVDLTLARFVFNAYLEACRDLGLEQQEAPLGAAVREILAHYPDYPTAQRRLGPVFLDLAGAAPETVYNTPNPMMNVFPGEEIGLHSPREIYQKAVNTWRNHRNEGGNELVFQPLQGARLGILDLEKFKRQVDYCTLPNGTSADMVLQVGGRRREGAVFEYMSLMGIWVENFSLPAVITECLMQSYSGELRLFPNWPQGKAARFETLRAVGAFLVSAELKVGKVAWIRVLSEAGGELKLVNPWKGAVRVDRNSKVETMNGARIIIPTQPGETLFLREAGE